MLRNRPLASPRRVHAVGSYGFRNYGDDLFVKTITARSSDLWPHSVVKTFVPTSSPTYARNNFLGSCLRLGSASIGALWADAVVMCGGSLLEDAQGVARLRMKFPPMTISETLGVAIGPFRDAEARARVRNLLSATRINVVRDAASLFRAEEIGLRRDRVLLGGDLAALNHSLKPANRNQNSITICPSSVAKVDVSALGRSAVSGLRAFRKTIGAQPEVTILALASGPSADDFTFASSLGRELDAAGFSSRVFSYAELGHTATTAMLAESGAIWSQRLHGAIVAYLTEVPFIVVGHHAKCVDFATDIGLCSDALVSSTSDWSRGAVKIATGTWSTKVSPYEYRNRAEDAYLGRLHVQD